MKHLYLSSQIHHVIHQIAKSLGDTVNQPTVFIDTALHAKKHAKKDLAWHFLNIKNMEEVGFHFDFYDIASKSTREIEHDLAKYQIMYIEGGDPFYLLHAGLANNFGNYVKRRVNEGMIYMSTSAGTIVAGPDAASASRPGKSPKLYNLTSTLGYSLVNFVPMPHWGLPEKVELYSQHKLNSAYQEDFPYVFISDNQYIEVVGEENKIIDVTIT